MGNETKRILSFLRDGDFAHPGEIEAIDLITGSIPKNIHQNILDIGCGLGGTANYLYQNGFGNVIGIDIDTDLINYALKKYTDISFVNCDVMESPKFLKQSFQLMICMNAFFCFKDQKESLKQLLKLADQNCELIIFDYSQFDSDLIESPFYWSKTASRFCPIHLDKFKKTLAESGWHYQSSIDITAQFEVWYQALLHQFEIKKQDMMTHFDHDLVNKMYDGYCQLLQLIRDKKVGGIVVYATRK